MSGASAQFVNAKYLNLETYRKTGAAVRTPVWFALENTTFYIYTRPAFGKVKRIRNNPKVRIAPCNFRGDLRGEWVDARARFCEGAEAEHGQKLLRRKYGLMKIIGDLFNKLKRTGQVVIAIEAA
jgi:PPOX class probable F420-dependent enzyme